MGRLPKGLKLVHATGLLFGRPSLAMQSGTYTFSVHVTTKRTKGHPAQAASQVLTLSVS